MSIINNLDTDVFSIDTCLLIIITQNVPAHPSGLIRVSKHKMNEYERFQVWKRMGGEISKSCMDLHINLFIPLCKSCYIFQTSHWDNISVHNVSYVKPNHCRNINLSKENFWT